MKSNMDKKFDYVFKILLIGDLETGKSSILQNFKVRIKQSKEFLETYNPTIAIDCYSKTFEIENSSIKGLFVCFIKWDSSGLERFKSITRSFFKGTHALIIVFDISKRETYKNLEKWMKEIRDFGSFAVFKLLVGNKSDLVSKRVVSYEEGLNFANAYEMPYIETSAKSGINIDNLVLFTFLNLLKKQSKSRKNKF